MKAIECFSRVCAAAAISAFDEVAANQVIARKWSDDQATQWLMRAATVPTSLANAPALVHTLLPDFIAALAAESAAARLFQESIKLSFGGAGQITVPSLVGNPNYAAFVGAGDPIPVVQGFSPLVTLTPKKLASIVVFTTEMVRSSNIEALMKDALLRSTALALDSYLFDDQPEDTARPVGIRNGLTPLAASSAPNALDALLSDIETLHSALDAVTAEPPPIFIMSPAKAQVSKVRTIGTLDNVFGSYALHGSNDVIAVAQKVLAVATDAVPQISSQRGSVTVHAEDTTPLPLVANNGTVATPARSMWQADCVAIKVRWPMTWALRSSGGVAWLTATNW